jgi:hypothetical protein
MWIVFGLVVIALVLVRMIFLGKFPGGMGYDELQVILSAKTYWRLGADVSLVKLPLSLIINKTEAGLAGLPSLLLSPVVGWQTQSLIASRVPYVVLNLITLILFSLLVLKLTSDKRLASLVVVVGLINPWFFALSRYPTEAPFFLFFTALGLYLLFALKNTKVIVSLIPFLLSFFSYYGAKPILILFVPLVLLVRSYYSKDIKWRFYLVYLVTFFMLIGVPHLFAGRFSTSSTLTYRIGRESILSTYGNLSSAVNDARRASILFPLKDAFLNKPAFFVRDLFKTYLGWSNPDFLFFGGDPRAMYRFGDHGMFYVPDAFFAVIGIVWLIGSRNKNKKILLMVASLMFLVAPVPAVINKNGISYFFRALLLIPPLLILISAGVVGFYEYLRPKFSKIFPLLLAGLYLILFINFLVFFFFRYPIKEFANQGTDVRILSGYLVRSLARDGRVIRLITTSPVAAYYQFLFYSDQIEKAGFVLTPVQGYYQIGNLIISQECTAPDKESTLILDVRVNCKNISDERFVSIQNPSDAGVEYKIFNDRLCDYQTLSAFKSETLLSDFEIEDMNDSRFCERWITI